MLLLLSLGFALGAIFVIAAEAILLLFALNWLRRRAQTSRPPDEVRGGGVDIDGDQSISSICSKQGIIWIFEPGNLDNEMERASKEQKKDLMEVSPVKKHATIRDHSLILTEVDGSQATIGLLNCTIVAVSASNLPSRKWAKRHPLKLENKDSEIYNGSKVCYIFLETSWEKESWCKALRLASSSLDNDSLKWYAQLKGDFSRYLASLNAVYPLLVKPSAVIGDTTEKTSTLDDSSSSKVRLFLKKLAKKSSKVGGRTISVPSTAYSEKNNSGKVNAFHDMASSAAASGSLKYSSADPASANSLASSDNKLYETISDDREFIDEGTLCWNLLFSRLFFDATRSSTINEIVKARIQRTLSNMRIPSYIGGITCTSLNLGCLPPFIHSAKVLPVNLNELWAVEIDMEYSGGLVLDIETRLDVREPELQRSIIDARPELDSSEEAAHDILDGIEYYNNKLNQSGALSGAVDTENQCDGTDGLKQSKSAGWTSTYLSRWKALKQSIADQVSQVPLSLAIRVLSLRGTLRFHIKPPPSDQLWFAFASMPDIEWNLESSIGDRKITNGHIALLISNRFKASIRDTLVLPNCASMSIPWMLAENDDWVPRKSAPFLWIKQEAAAETTDLEASKDPLPSIPQAPPSNGTFDDLHEPLLLLHGNHNETQSGNQVGGGSNSPERLTMVAATEVDGKQKKMGRKARMMDLGKKMGEKLDEKRRHFEEKGKIIVERIRENSSKS